MKIAVIGMGYVGLTTAASLAHIGHEIYGVEIDEAKLNLLKEGKTPIYEEYLDGMLSQLDLQTGTFSHYRLKNNNRPSRREECSQQRRATEHPRFRERHGKRIPADDEGKAKAPEGKVRDLQVQLNLRRVQEQ